MTQQPNTTPSTPDPADAMTYEKRDFESLLPGEAIVRPAVSGDVHGHLCCYICPRRPSEICGVPIKPLSSPPYNNGWDWDGNTEAPTLTPSVNCIAERDGKPTGGCGWHGWVKAGKLEGA